MKNLMNRTGGSVLAAVLIVGCGGSPGNKAFHPSAADKATAESALKQIGVERPVAAMVDYDDHWLVTVEIARTAEPIREGVFEMPRPEVYKVFKDGRVDGVAAGKGRPSS